MKRYGIALTCALLLTAGGAVLLNERLGEIAERSGFSASALRFYEREGLLETEVRKPADDHVVSLLVSGGVVGAQMGVRVGAKLRGEQLRLLLACLVLAVGAGLLWQLVARPADVYSLSEGVP